MSANTPQTINVSDLDLPQLADVRRQLEEVRKCQIPDLNKMFTPKRTGTQPPNQLFHPIKGCSGKVHGMFGECCRD